MKKITFVFFVGLLMLFSFVSCSKKDNTIVIYSCAEDYRNEYYLAELQKQFNDRQAKLNQELVNMDGVIAEVNKVMGIEVPDQIKGDE